MCVGRWRRAPAPWSPAAKPRMYMHMHDHARMYTQIDTSAGHSSWGTPHEQVVVTVAPDQEATTVVFVYARATEDTATSDTVSPRLAARFVYLAKN